MTDAPTHISPATKKRGLQALLSQAGALINRGFLAARAGLQFGGARDLYEVFGYKRTPQFQDFLAMYTRQDIVKRVVDAHPDACWSSPPTLNADGDEFSKAWEESLKVLEPWNAFSRADKLAGLGDYSVVLVGLDDGRKLERPIGKATRVTYLQPYGVESAEIHSVVDDPRDPRYAQPEFYRIKPSDPTITSIKSKTTSHQLRDFLVHHSRIIHIAENTLENDIFGIPRILSVYNLFFDLAKVVGGSAETFWLIANRGMQLDVDKDIEMSTEDAETLTDEIEEFQHQLRRVIRTRGVKIETLGSDSPDPHHTFDMLIALISGTTGIPKRILIGSEAGQLASEQDRANWAERVDERRRLYAFPRILRAYVDIMFAAGILPDPKGLRAEWPEAFQMSPLEKGQTSAQLARSVINLQRVFTDSSKLGIPSIITPDESRVILAAGLQGIFEVGSSAPTEVVVPELPEKKAEAEAAEAADARAREAEDEEDAAQDDATQRQPAKED